MSMNWQDNSSNELGFRIERTNGSPSALSVTLKTYNGANTTPTVELAGSANSFKAGALVVNDRSDTWAAVPAALDGKTRLLAARDDRMQAPTARKYVVTVSGPCTIYLPLDPRYGGAKLAWMDGTWTDSGLTCNSSVSSGWTIWQKTISAAGDVTLGCDEAAYDGACYVFAGGPNWAEVATVAADAQSWSDAGLNASSTYSYRVCATNAAGISPYSNEPEATTSEQDAADIPIARDATWAWRKGTAEASEPADAWRAVRFDDSDWATGPAPFGYGDGPYGTPVAGMPGSYNCIFLRTTFAVERPAIVTALTLWTLCDDGFIAWLNGEEIARWNMAGEPGMFVPFDALAALGVGDGTEWSNTWTAGTLPVLRIGTNVLAVQVFNVETNSSDLTFDAKLSGSSDPLSVADDGDQDGAPDEWETAEYGGAGVWAWDDDPDGTDC